jgi:hypothetical protein
MHAARVCRLLPAACCRRSAQGADAATVRAMQLRLCEGRRTRAACAGRCSALQAGRCRTDASGGQLQQADADRPADEGSDRRGGGRWRWCGQLVLAWVRGAARGPRRCWNACYGRRRRRAAEWRRRGDRQGASGGWRTQAESRLSGGWEGRRGAAGGSGRARGRMRARQESEGEEARRGMRAASCAQNERRERLAE